MGPTRFALVGSPIDRSPSPAMHNAGFAALGLDWRYELRPTEPAAAPEVLRELRSGVYKGVNVTTPLKTVLAPAVKKDTEAARAGAVNTLWANKDGVFGALTDVQGVSEPLSQRELAGAVGLIVGAGGAARAAVLGLESLGLVAHVAARRPDEAERLLRELSPAGGGEAQDLSDRAALARLFPTLAVIVQATPAGREGASPELPWEAARPALVAFEMLYLPRRTPFLEAAATAGCRTIEGWEMLLCQGARSFELWTKLPAPRSVMQAALLEALSRSAGGGR